MLRLLLDDGDRQPGEADHLFGHRTEQQVSQTGLPLAPMTTMLAFAFSLPAGSPAVYPDGRPRHWPAAEWPRTAQRTSGARPARAGQFTEEIHSQRCLTKPRLSSTERYNKFLMHTSSFSPLVGAQRRAHRRRIRSWRLLRQRWRWQRAPDHRSALVSAPHCAYPCALHVPVFFRPPGASWSGSCCDLLLARSISAGAQNFLKLGISGNG